MNIARFGIEVDPTGARAGANAAAAAITSVGTAAAQTQAKVTAAGTAQENAQKKAGDSADKMHKGMQAGAKKTSIDFAGMTTAATGFLTNLGGMMPGSIGLFANMAGMVAQLAIGLAGLITAASAAGVAEAELAGATTAAAAAATAETAANAAETASFGALALAMLPVVAGLIALTAALVAAGAAAYGTWKAINASAGLQTTELQYQILIGNTKKTQEALENLRKFADDSPFSTDDVLQYGVAMLNAGVASDQLVEKMKTLGNVAFGNAQKMQTAVLVYTQTMMSGRLNGGDLLQFANAGIPIIEGLASAMHVTKAEVKGLVEDGKVGFKELQAAIDGLGGPTGRLGTLMDASAKTWSGHMSTISAGWDNLLIAFGKPVRESLSALLPKLEQYLKDLVPKAQAAGEAMGKTFSTLIGLWQTGGVGEVAGLSLKIAFEEATNTLVKGILTGIGLMGPLLLTVVQTAVEGFMLLGKPSFWRATGSALFAIAADFGSRLLDVMLKPIAALQAGMEGAATQLLNNLPTFLGGNEIEVKFDFAASTSQYQTALRNNIIGPAKEGVKDMYAEAKAQSVLAFGELASNLQQNLKAVATSAGDIFASLGNFFPEQDIAVMRDQLEEVLKRAEKVGEKLKETIELKDRAQTPPEPENPLTAGKKKTFTTDNEVIADYRAQLEFLKREESSLSAQEATRRRMALEQKALNELEDPLKQADKYPTLLDRWRAYQRERAIIAQEADDKINAGQASAAEGLTRGLQNLVEKWGNMAKQIEEGITSLAETTSSAISSNLSDWITGAKTAKEAFADMAKSILKAIVDIITKMLVQLAIASILKAVMGSTTGGAAGYAEGGLVTPDGAAAVASVGGNGSGGSSGGSGGSGAGAAAPSNPFTEPDLPSGSGTDFSDPFGDLDTGSPSKPTAPGTDIPFRYAVGGRISGGRGGVDDIPAWLTAGEFVMPKDAVQYYGLNRMEQMRAKRFADGGAVGLHRDAPATMRPGRSSNGTGSGVNLHVAVDAGDSGGDLSPETWKKIAGMIGAEGRNIIVRERRPGGLLEKGR